MSLETLQHRPEINAHPKLKKRRERFQRLLILLAEREIPQDVEVMINEYVHAVNTTPPDKKTLGKQLTKSQSKVLELVESKLGLVPRNHYRNKWTGMGMAVFGMPIGVAMGTALGSMAYLALGLPIGMSIGLAVGSGKDQAAKKAGRQLDFEV